MWAPKVSNDSDDCQRKAFTAGRRPSISVDAIDLFLDLADRDWRHASVVADGVPYIRRVLMGKPISIGIIDLLNVDFGFLPDSLYRCYRARVLWATECFTKDEMFRSGDQCRSLLLVVARKERSLLICR